jgi:hypothetical protein
VGLRYLYRTLEIVSGPLFMHDDQDDCDVLLGKSKEAERKRINKELANIRSKFKGNQFYW